MSELFWAGIAALEDYIALHVLTCLVPAFLLAGAMVCFISRETNWAHTHSGEEAAASALLKS